MKYIFVCGNLLVVTIVLPLTPDQTGLTKVVAALISSPRQQIITRMMVFHICHFGQTENLNFSFRMATDIYYLMSSQNQHWR